MVRPAIKHFKISLLGDFSFLDIKIELTLRMAVFRPRPPAHSSQPWSNVFKAV